MKYLIEKSDRPIVERILEINHVCLKQLDVSNFVVDKNIEVLESFKEKLLSFKDKRFFIVGDYDCDGICATAIMKKLFDDLFIQSNYYIPSRSKEGYGINSHMIDVAKENGFDVSIRLAPFLYKTADFDKINNIKVDKCLVEFLRVKPSMQKHLPFIDFNDYKLKEGGYRHLDISTKLAVIKKLKFKELSVCDDVWRHYQYFKNNINYNPEDCCNLRL